MTDEEPKEEIIEDEITTETIDKTLETAPMLEGQEKEIKTLKDEIAELKAMIAELTKPKEEPKEEKSLEEKIKEILDKKLKEDVPEGRTGQVNPEEQEEKFTEKKATKEDMVKVIEEMTPEERQRMGYKWGQNLIGFVTQNPVA